MKIWVDDVRPAPEGYVWCKSVNDFILFTRLNGYGVIEELSLDHDAGDYFSDGGDFIEILKLLERNEYFSDYRVKFPISIHSMNPVGAANMRAIIEKNGWTEVK